jgi:hypothetical protein
MKHIKCTFLLSLGLIALLALGCGGGGGGGDGTVVTTTTGTPTTGGTTTTPGTTTGNAPAGYESAGFPALSANMTVSPASGKSSIVLVNHGSTDVSVALTAQATGFAASVQANDSSGKPRLSVVASRPNPDQRLHGLLRRLEKTMPSFSAGVAANRTVSGSPAIRADFLGQQVKFDVLSGMGTGQKQTVTATCRKITSISGSDTKINFYFDNSATYDSDAEALVNQLDAAWATIYPTVRATFGSEPPASFNSLGNDITVLISPVVDSAGFFYSGDLYAPSQVQGGVSNQRKMFYLQFDLEELTVEALASTMAHEFQHMINFYQRRVNNLEEEDWLNEAMSGYAEHVCGYKVSTNNQSKALQMNQFFAAIEALPLVIEPWPGEHENYGQVYLFGTWLGQQYGSSGSLASLLASLKVGSAAVAELTGETFETTFSKWMVALFVNDTTGNIYGYKDIDLRKTYSYSGNLADVTLTGPKSRANSSVFPYSSGQFTVQKYSSAFVELSGANGATLNITLPTGVSSFELHK